MLSRNHSHRPFTHSRAASFTGLIAASLWAAAYFQTQVAASTCPCEGGRLVAWWRGDGNAVDTIGGHNGTLVGNTAFVTGVAGQAFRFDGDGDGVAIGNPP